MTGSSFRGPPDENVACVRIEPDGPTRVAVVCYFPRGRSGHGPRARWPMLYAQENDRADELASALSDLLWHAREDGARYAKEQDALARNVLGVGPRCSECGGTGGACHAPGPAFPVEHGTSVPKVSVAMRGRDLPPVPFRVYFHATKPPERRYFGTVKCVGMATIEVAWDDDPDPVTVEKREDLGARIQLVPSAIPTPEEYHATMKALDRPRPSLIARLFGRRS